ncbi:MAG: ComEC/Rec2 family competence protein [Paracoccaceae bacterium]
MRVGWTALWVGGRGLLQALADARGTLLPWSPVCLSVGIGLYFTLPVEPPVWLLVLAAMVVLAGMLMARRGPDLARYPAAAVALLAAGLLLAVLRAHLVAAPVLPFRFYGAVEGRVVDIDRSFSDQIRLTLDMVRLEEVRADETPARVRVALHGDQMGYHPKPGQRVMLTAHLSPPEGPVAPGGFDFQRLAWFSQLGAVGYTRAPVMLLAEPRGDFGLWAFDRRMSLSEGMQARMRGLGDGQPGAFAAALMTGDRSAVSHATNEILRRSNLSHMISISGLHMGLLTGFVFALFRYGLALVPPVALRINVKKFAAVAALIAASFYLLLAGPEVAIRRAYIMAAVMLVAVMFDRRALSLRSVAIAALICLVLEPESLIEPGFQMSFGATATLIVGFDLWGRVQHLVPKAMRPILVTLLSSLIAGTATAPIAAAHFNRIADYGLLANLLAVPVLGLVVMPMGVLAAMLAPLGLAFLPLWIMEVGCLVILNIGDWVGNLRGAVQTVPTPPMLVLPLFGLAGAVMLLGRGPWVRGLGLAGVVAALIGWGMAVRPQMLVSADGSLVGVMTTDGRALSKAKGAGFVAKSWLEDDGDAADQETAAARPAFTGEKGALFTALAGQRVAVLTGKAAAAQAQEACTPGTLLILSVVWDAASPPDCELFDLKRLRQTGSLALYQAQDGLIMVTARDWAGRRLWNSRERARRVRR